MKNFSAKIQNKFDIMSKTGKLFRVSLTGREVWDLYLASFKDGDDPIFRDPESSAHNCNHCKNFIRRYGNIVSVDKDYNTVSMFDVDIDDEFKPVALALNKAITVSTIKEVFFETYNELNGLPYESCSKNDNKFQLGVDSNTKRYTKEEAELYGVVKPNEIRKFDHLYLKVGKVYVDNTGASVESIMADYRSAKEVFKRAMDEIPASTLHLVKDLIIQGSLLNGDTHLHKIEKFLPFKEEYDKLPVKAKDNWCWVTSYKLPIAKFRNELIGVLCTELAEGEELNKACQSWNKRVDPANYMKAVAPITKAQIKMAKEFVEENGYAASFNRRTATIDDIKVTEIKHINVGDGEIKEVSIFDNVKPAKSHQHKRNEFDNIEEVTIEKFMDKILPECDSVEAYLKNGHVNNMVTLTTAKEEETKEIFQWHNNYGWTFNGNLAGKSEIKEAVKAQGGGVTGVLRFSIMWAEDDVDNSDLDAHCIEPEGFEIYYGNKRSGTGGILDIDITQPQSHKSGGKKVVENITYPSLDRMKDGVYKLFVRQYAGRGSKGFRAEIEFDDQIYTYTYDKAVSGNVHVAEVTLNKGEFTIKHKLPETGAFITKEIYGLESEAFHKVNLVCLSPNHWGDNKIGNKHYFFTLQDCKTDKKLRGFHNENLKPDLAKHRKVLEVLGSTNMIEPGDKQLSGLGFNSTVRDELIVKLAGNFKRMIKIKF